MARERDGGRFRLATHVKSPLGQISPFFVPSFFALVVLALGELGLLARGGRFGPVAEAPEEQT